MQRPGGGLDREPDHDRQRGDHLGGVAQAGAAGGGEGLHVEGARLEADQQEAEQHHGRAEQRVQDEPVRGRHLGAAPPAGDQEVHRDQHDLEGQEEEHQVQHREGGQHAHFEEEEQPDEGPGRGHALAGRQPPLRVQRAEECEQRGQHQQRQRDAVHPEVEAHPDGRDPGHVGGGLHPGGLVVVEARRQGDGEHQDGAGQHRAEAQRPPVGGGRVRAEHRGQGERGAEQRQHQEGDEDRVHRALLVTAAGEDGRYGIGYTATRTTSRTTPASSALR